MPLATGRSAMLLVLVAWHALLIAMPMATLALACLRAGMRDVTALATCALAGGGVLAFVIFWIWWMSPTAGALASTLSAAGSAAAIAWLGARLDRATLRHAGPLGVAALLWAAYGLFVLAFGLAPSGFQSPLNVVQHHFGLALPYDNELPFIFAQQVATDRVSVPMSLDWLTSDRPPLQAAYFLASGGAFLPRPEVHYQVAATLLQTLWLPAMALLLLAFRVSRGALVVALAATMLSGFALINGIFTWPKLFPVAYFAVVTAIVLAAPRETIADARVAAATGACVALALLCHPGSVFFLAGLGVALVVLRRVPDRRFTAIAAAVAVVVALPWALYQKYWDPPGNRLMKWHLADASEVDARTIGEALRDAYGAITFEQLADNKLENLRKLGGPPESIALVAKASTIGVSDEDAGRLLNLQFFYIAATLGVLCLAPLAWLVPTAWRTREFATSLRLFAVCVFTVIPWILVIFPRGGTVIHTGSYAVPCFLFAAAMLAFYAASRWLAIAALALHTLLVVHVYARAVPLAQGASAEDYVAFNVLALVALAMAGITLMLLARAARAPAPPPSPR